MKTHSIEWSELCVGENRLTLDPARRLPRLMNLVSKAFLALVPALAIIVGAAWLITLPEHLLLLQALIGTSGFIFLGLAVEAETVEVSILSLATGILLPVLSWLSSPTAVELLIVAAALIAAWTAASILRR